ncbi:hypothetical protein ACSBR1_032223 [Camellia fascicularis]
MKKALPSNGKIAKDAKDTVQECVSEFISFITNEASDKCQKEKRKTINGDDLLCAMATLGFEDYIASLKVYLTRIKMDIDVPASVAYNCYSDREAIPRWMPFISSVKILEDKPDLSQWSLKYEAFGRDIEFSWLARNMQPIPNQKIHWRSLDGLPNRGVVRFFPKGPSSCVVELTVSYEVPQILVPVASALQPFLESLLARGLERFKGFVKSYSTD